jgi:hypothetical protein
MAAILLGSVTMFVPLALLGPSNLIPDDNHLETVPEAGGKTAERNNILTAPEASTEQFTDTETSTGSGNESTKSGATLGGTNLISNLSSVVLITIPSFLMALGVFVYFKRRTI